MLRSSSFLLCFQFLLLGLLTFTLSSTSVVPTSINRQLEDAALSSSSSRDSDDQSHLTNLHQEDDDNDMAPWTSIADQSRMIRAGYAAGNPTDNRLWAIPYRFGKRSAMPYRFGKRAAAMHFRLGKKSVPL